MKGSIVAGLMAGAALVVKAEFAEDIFFIVQHGQLTATRLDPIVSPGGISSHVHAIVGGSNFGPVYDYDQSIKSECTTATIAVDHSNYWVPQMYNKFSNGTVGLAGLSYVNTYYQLRRQPDEPTYEFPPGFRMLAGDPDRTTLDLNDPAQDAVRYVCLGGSSPEGHEFPPERCPDGMRAQVYFPHCWDGINSWLEGSKHVAYGEGRFDGGGKCPPTHPKRIMGLFYEFIFHDHEEYRKGGRVWANGDDVGYSLHADFTNGWPVGFFSEIFSFGRQCSVGFDVKSCPALAPHFRDDHQCAYNGVKIVEDIGDNGAIAKLPGNNPRAADYTETASFNSGAPSPTRITAVPATSIIMATVKGDTPQSAPPDAIPQSGQATASSAASSSAFDGSVTASSSVVVSTSPSSTSAASSAATSMPGGGAVLIGQQPTGSSGMASSSSVVEVAEESASSVAATSTSQTGSTAPTGAPSSASSATAAAASSSSGPDAGGDSAAVETGLISLASGSVAPTVSTSASSANSSSSSTARPKSCGRKKHRRHV